MTIAVGVVGGGSFGRALARAAAREGNDVKLWSRSPRDLDSELIIHTSNQRELAGCELIFIAVPSPYVAMNAESLGPHLDGSHLLVHVSRGLVSDEPQTLTQMLRQRTPCRRVGCLAGPLVAGALMAGVPGGGIVGTRFDEVAAAVREAIAGPTFRIYETHDVIGVEIASAMVGLLALTLGYAGALGLGPSTLAVLATRGMAEAARIGVTLGADPKTFYGLAGFGDLLAAVGGDERPEVQLGRQLGHGATLEQAGADVGAHIEGIAIAQQVSTYARRVGIEVPISDTLARVLTNEVSAEAAISFLMALDVRTE